MKKYIAIFLVAAFGAGTGILFQRYFQQDSYYNLADLPAIHLAKVGGTATLAYPDFVQASALALPAVVHVTSSFKADPQAKLPGNSWFPDFFGNPQLQRQAAGSGVIISGDGYIATNNHVVKDADEVEVTMYDKRTYKAKVVGTDPSTDLALLKISEKQLPFLTYGNSDQVAVGEWVLAVGNPFNLTSTVTAGIVSAKGRSLNILNGDFKIESFIQTDAAVNPGNSGGALINARGEVIGINTAIASESGRYEGYSFAIPANLVKKVIGDLKDFGKVQRGIIGIKIQNIDANFAQQSGLDVLQGVYVAGVIPGGAAEQSGIVQGDVITQINETEVKSSSELQEIVGQFRPGDQVKVNLIRNGSPKQIDVTLKGIEVVDDLIASNPTEPSKGFSHELGASLRNLSEAEKSKLGLDYGVKVTDVNFGLLSEMGIQKGFTIVKINNKAVDDATTAETLLTHTQGALKIEGLNADGSRGFYSMWR